MASSILKTLNFVDKNGVTHSYPIPYKTSDLTNDSNFITAFPITITATEANGETTYSADKTFNEIAAAITAGKNVYVIFNGIIYPLLYSSDSYAVFGYSAFEPDETEPYIYSEFFTIDSENIYYTSGEKELAGSTSDLYIPYGSTNFTIDYLLDAIDNGTTLYCAYSDNTHAPYATVYLPAIAVRHDVSLTYIEFGFVRSPSGADIPYTLHYQTSCSASSGDNIHWNPVVTKDFDVFQTKSNLVTTLSSASTDTQYPSAKAVYDAINGSGSSPVTYTYTDPNNDGNIIISQQVLGTLDQSQF